LTYRYQREALGIAQAIGLARDFVGGDTCCVVLGDNILRGASLRAVAAAFETSGAGAGCVLYHVDDARRFGVAELDDQGRVVAFEEKPEHPKSDVIPIGVYFLRSEAFAVIDTLKLSARGELEITELLNHFAREERLASNYYDGHWSDAGTHDSLLHAARLSAGQD
jgi:glucose-1-phosphate thymidylyltransferase